MNGTGGINPDTGLPALPDGQWWEVTEEPANDYRSARVRVAVMSTARRDVVEAVEVEVPGRWPWSKPVTRKEVQKTGVEDVPVMVDSALVWDEQNHQPYGGYLHPAQLTQKHILETAERVIRMQVTRAKEEEAERAARALLGKYPPKRLGETR